MIGGSCFPTTAAAFLIMVFIPNVLKYLDDALTTVTGRYEEDDDDVQSDEAQSIDDVGDEGVSSSTYVRVDDTRTDIVLPILTQIIDWRQSCRIIRRSKCPQMSTSRSTVTYECRRTSSVTGSTS